MLGGLAPAEAAFGLLRSGECPGIEKFLVPFGGAAFKPLVGAVHRACVHANGFKRFNPHLYSSLLVASGRSLERHFTTFDLTNGRSRSNASFGNAGDVHCSTLGGYRGKIQACQMKTPTA